MIRNVTFDNITKYIVHGDKINSCLFANFSYFISMYTLHDTT